MLDIELVKSRMVKDESRLSSYAALSADAIRFQDIDEGDIRPAFFRDIDRIIYSLSYSRYGDKTQVFSYIDNDHISRRIVHVQLVSKIARTIGRALNLNEDLIEAISLGHDIGHAPLGHFGEEQLDRLSMKYASRHFLHNVHSVRMLMFLENQGKGTNLTLQVLDGIMCHNGEVLNGHYAPNFNKTKEEFLRDYDLLYQDKSYDKKMVPMTLEACVMRISDVIGYIGRDIDDAICLGLIQRSDIPEHISKVLGNSTKDIVNTLIHDVIEHSFDQPYIAMSRLVFEALIELKNFNYQFIYNRAFSDQERIDYAYMFDVLFEVYLKQLKEHDQNGDFYKEFLCNMDDVYFNTTDDVQKVIDFIAGMTDDYLFYQYSLYQNK